MFALLAQCVLQSAAQICLRWGIQRGIVLIPKSVTPERIAQNADIFDFNLSSSEMAAIDQLHCGFRVVPHHDKRVHHHPQFPYHEEF